MGLAVVARFQSFSEAEVACATLRSADFPAVVLDDPFGSDDLSHGIRVCVPEPDVLMAKMLLAAARDIGEEAG